MAVRQPPLVVRGIITRGQEGTYLCLMKKINKKINPVQSSRLQVLQKPSLLVTHSCVDLLRVFKEGHSDAHRLAC